MVQSDQTITTHITNTENAKGDGSSISRLEFMHILEKLKTTKRAGWLREKATEPESISDHMYRMALLAMMSEEDSNLNISKCVMLALVHDLAEAEVGDITPLDGISKQEKHRRESEAIEHFTTKLSSERSIAAKRIRDLWEEYESGQTHEAKFVKDLDRFELALQGVEYEKRDRLSTLQPFFEDTITKIQHPEVRNWANNLMNERLEFQNSNQTIQNFKDIRPEQHS